MKDEIKTPRLVNFFKGLLLVLAILTSLSVLMSAWTLTRPHNGQATQSSLLVLNAIGALMCWAAFLALAKGKPYGRWLAATTYVFLTGHVVWGLFWYFVAYNGPTNIFTTGVVVGLNIVQFGLYGWGALTFAFPPKASPHDTAAESLPPPPPSFDS